jgi:hypothetical protein
MLIHNTKNANASGFKITKNPEKQPTQHKSHAGLFF